MMTTILWFSLGLNAAFLTLWLNARLENQELLRLVMAKLAERKDD